MIPDVLIRDPNVVKREFHDTIERLYNPLAEDAARYREYAHELSLPLDQGIIQRLTNRLGYAKKRTSDILNHIRENSGTLYPILEPHLDEITENAWFFQTATEIAVERVLRYTSVRMKYFPKTFEKLERVDPYRINKLSRSEKLTILEIAGQERDL